ncbi:hypothetical protein, partial [Pseudomonas azotoformans]|uniref:hypothetical protein n=1 Tax=Pseudomonas azotoformans TaxID=47878 RepID=UPI001C3160FD
PSVGARALCLLWGFSKVSRRKGGTNIRRYPNNGYVLNSKTPANPLSPKNRHKTPRFYWVHISPLPANLLKPNIQSRWIFF